MKHGSSKRSLPLRYEDRASPRRRSLHLSGTHHVAHRTLAATEERMFSEPGSYLFSRFLTVRTGRSLLLWRSTASSFLLMLTLSYQHSLCRPGSPEGMLQAPGGLIGAWHPACTQGVEDDQGINCSRSPAAESCSRCIEEAENGRCGCAPVPF
jgi:hypothetical protein